MPGEPPEPHAANAAAQPIAATNATLRRGRMVRGFMTATRADRRDEHLLADQLSSQRLVQHTASGSGVGTAGCRLTGPATARRTCPHERRFGCPLKGTGLCSLLGSVERRDVCQIFEDANRDMCSAHSA